MFLDHRAAERAMSDTLTLRQIYSMCGLSALRSRIPIRTRTTRYRKYEEGRVTTIQPGHGENLLDEAVFDEMSGFLRGLDHSSAGDVQAWLAAA